jgi:hypothetical protein
MCKRKLIVTIGAVTRVLWSLLPWSPLEGLPIVWSQGRRPLLDPRHLSTCGKVLELCFFGVDWEHLL